MRAQGSEAARAEEQRGREEPIHHTAETLLLQSTSMVSSGACIALAGFSGFGTGCCPRPTCARAPRVASTRSLALCSPGVFFLSLLAILIKSNYPYVAEWYNLEGEEGRGPMPYQEQKEVVVSALWQAVGVYLVAGVVSVLGLGWNRVRGR